MEFIKEHHSQEFVKEVLRISCDGNTVRISSLFNVTPRAYCIVFFKFSFKQLCAGKCFVNVCADISSPLHPCTAMTQPYEFGLDL